MIRASCVCHYQKGPGVAPQFPFECSWTKESRQQDRGTGEELFRAGPKAGGGKPGAADKGDVGASTVVILHSETSAGIPYYA